LASILAGPLAALLLSFDGTLHLEGWQWLFLVEGSAAVAVGLAVSRVLPEDPSEAMWLNATARNYLRQVVQPVHRNVTLSQLWVAMRASSVWQLASINFTINASLFAMDLWTPQILRAQAGLTDAQIGLAVVVPNLVAAIGMIAVGTHADRSKEARLHIAAPVLIAALGLALASAVATTAGLIGALTLARLSALSAGPFWALTTRRLGRVEDSAAVAFVTTIGVSTGLVWPYVVGVIKESTMSFGAGLLTLSVVLLLGAGTVLVAPVVRHCSRHVASTM
jgi:sugar phosphate permease